MGCFLACFGCSKARIRRKQRQNKVQPREQRKVGYRAEQSAASLVQECPERPISQLPEIQDKPEEQLSLSTRKILTFDSNLKTHAHVSVEQSTDFSVEQDDGSPMEMKEEENLAKCQTNSSSEDNSITSSFRSYHPNHRYQNCRDSDDELEYEESNIDNGEDEDGSGLDYNDIYEENGTVEARSRAHVVSEENDCSMVVSGLPEREGKLNRNVRDRRVYARPVLNPVENLTQWKAVKAAGTPTSKHQKENLTLKQEAPRVSFSSDPSFKESSFSFKTMSDHQPKKSTQEIAVNASLSNWLGSSEFTPINKPSTVASDIIMVGSNSPRSFDDRAILGALTMEELKQFSTSSSPMRSPRRSPDEMPIIGTVGTYWNHGGSAKDSGSGVFYKGIPNTASKYREVVPS